MSDLDIRQLERIYQTTQSEDDWTALAIAKSRAGQMLPAPPDSFCPGFHFMSADEIKAVLAEARVARRRVEGVYAPEHGIYAGYIKDYPEKNVRLHLPHWTKCRFYVGLSLGRQGGGGVVIPLMLFTSSSTGGHPIYAGEFVYVRMLTDVGRGGKSCWK